MILLREREVDPGKSNERGVALRCQEFAQRAHHKRFRKEFLRQKVPRLEERDEISENFGEKKRIKLKNIDQRIFFLTDGYFDFNDRIWKSGKTHIRRVNVIASATNL